jgi:Tfp pilus assembly protein PilN
VLRTNLSTRPFYNERAVQLLLALAGVLVLALTAYNVIRVVSLSRQNTEFSAMINRDRAEAQRLNAEAQKIRAGINQDELKATADAAAEANRLIEQRTFSWTEFFNRIEETLPDDVMLTAVQPSFEQREPVVVMTVLGRRTEDIEEFIEKLEGTGAFGQVLPTQTDTTDEGLNRVVLRSRYTPQVKQTTETPAAEAPAPGGAAGQPAPAPGRGGPAR